MSINSIWFNLSAKDIQKSKSFYKAIGFRENPLHEKAANRAGFFMGKHDVVLMLFTERDFKQMAGNEPADTKKGTEVLLSMDAQRREEVDEMAETVRRAGGHIFSEPAEAQGWMYACGFEDPDGHRYNMLYMDMGKLPQ